MKSKMKSSSSGSQTKPLAEKIKRKYNDGYQTFTYYIEIEDVKESLKNIKEELIEKLCDITKAIRKRDVQDVICKTFEKYEGEGK